MSWFDKLSKGLDEAKKELERVQKELEAQQGSAPPPPPDRPVEPRPAPLTASSRDRGGAPALPSTEHFAPGGQGRAFRVATSAAGTDSRGRRVFRTGVGVSLTSRAEAEAEARANAERLLQDAVAGRAGSLSAYAYHADRRLEPVVDTIEGPSGTVARVTVNAYGSLVLNATRAMFVDVDSGGENADPGRMPVPPELTDLVGRRSDLGFRVYRTLAGWRYLCTTATFDPASEETRTILTELGSDEKFVTLCRIQKTFRARLTPKAWRAGEAPPTIGSEGVARGELQDLIERTWGYATARYLTAVGSAQLDPAVGPIVDAHDRWTQAASAKPLA